MVDCPRNSSIAAPLRRAPAPAPPAARGRDDCGQLPAAEVPHPRAAVRLPLARVHQGEGH